MDKSAYDPMKKSDKEYQGSFWNFSGKDASEIEREIRLTRADLDETVHALQAKLAPQSMVNHFFDMTRDAMRDTAPRFAEAIRQNPLPAVVAGFGLAWLFVRSQQPRIRRRTSIYGGTTASNEDYLLASEGQFSATEETDMSTGIVGSTQAKVKDWAGGAKDWAGEKGSQVKESSARMADQARDKASQLASATKDKASQMAENVKHKAAETASNLADYAKEKVSNLAGYTKGKASDLGGYTKEKASHLADVTMDTASHLADATMETASNIAGATMHKAGQIVDFTTERAHDAMVATRQGAVSLGHSTKEGLNQAGQRTSEVYMSNPWIFGIACIGLGAAIALGLPSTQKERELMGEASDQLIDRAQAAGSQAMSTASNIIQAGGSAMKEEAQREELI